MNGDDEETRFCCLLVAKRPANILIHISRTGLLNHLDVLPHEDITTITIIIINIMIIIIIIIIITVVVLVVVRCFTRSSFEQKEHLVGLLAA